MINLIKKIFKWGLIVFACFVGLIVFLIIVLPKDKSKQINNPQTVSTNSLPTEVPKKNYEILGKTENKVVENYSVLVPANEQNGKNIALEVKKQCKKKCNIDIYDDNKAYELQKLYNDMMGDTNTKQTDLTKWKNDYYVYVADHLIGSVDFETGEYQEFPFRDWQYKELKAK